MDRCAESRWPDKELLILSYFLFLTGQAQTKSANELVNEVQAWPRKRNKKEAGYRPNSFTE